MASYHLSAREFSRGAGDSAVHAAAYRARCELTDERTGLKHDYSRKAGELLFEGIYAPKDAPDWAHDRAQLWNHVEAFEKHRRAILAREFNIALPHELTLEQNRYALQDWIRENFTRKGLIADAVIHAPDKRGDQRNIHAHVMVVTRKLDGSEFIRAKERFDTYSEKDAARKAELESLRESWERIGNRHLERHGFEPALDRRSLAEQGIDREPTTHLGKDATALERDGAATDRGDINRAIQAENERREIERAAERAMQEAREAAKGRTDDIRPPERQAGPDNTRQQRVIDLAAERAMQEQRAAAKGRVDDVRPAAQEATQRPERDAAAEMPARAAAPSRGPQKTATAAPAEPGLVRGTRQMARAAEKTNDKAGHVFGRVLGGLGSAVEKMLSGLFDFFVAPPKLTRDQAERKARADEEKAEARADEAARQEKEAARDEQSSEQKRREQQTDQDLYSRFGGALTRDPDERARERDGGRHRDRER